MRRAHHRPLDQRPGDGRGHTDTQEYSAKKHTRTAAVPAVIAGSVLLLTACASGPYPGVPELLPANTVDRRSGPVALPQVVYRIDENRYFELVPRSEGACTDATVYYADKKLGIRSLVVKWDRGAMGGSAFIIDAANEQYLIGPVTRGNADCSSGGGTCGGARLPYSTDAGRTWKRADAQSAYDAMAVSGSTAYSTGVRDLTDGLDLTRDHADDNKWIYLRGFTFAPRKPPLDTKFQCAANGKE